MIIMFLIELSGVAPVPFVRLGVLRVSVREAAGPLCASIEAPRQLSGVESAQFLGRCLCCFVDS